jgi:hypothetical protein
MDCRDVQRSDPTGRDSCSTGDGHSINSGRRNRNDAAKITGRGSRPPEAEAGDGVRNILVLGRFLLGFMAFRRLVRDSTATVGDSVKQTLAELKVRLSLSRNIVVAQGKTSSPR